MLGEPSKGSYRGLSCGHRDFGYTLANWDCKQDHAGQLSHIFRYSNLTFALLRSVMGNVLHLAYFWIILHISPFLSNTEILGSDSVNPHLV